MGEAILFDGGPSRLTSFTSVDFATVSSIRKGKRLRAVSPLQTQLIFRVQATTCAWSADHAVAFPCSSLLSLTGTQNMGRLPSSLLVAAVLSALAVLLALATALALAAGFLAFFFHETLFLKHGQPPGCRTVRALCRRTHRGRSRSRPRCGIVDCRELICEPRRVRHGDR